MANNIFEQIKKVNEYGKEYWSARDLMTPLGYVRWENFEVAVARAKESCKNSGQNVDDHFAGATKMVHIGSGTERSMPESLPTPDNIKESKKRSRKFLTSFVMSSLLCRNFQQ